MRNSLLRALARFKSEGNDDGKREKEKELKENLKRKMEMVVGNVLKEMYDTRRNDGSETRDVMLLRTDVDGLGMMERGVVKHVRFVGECVVDEELKSNEMEDKNEYVGKELEEEEEEEGITDKKYQEVEEEMKVWWKLGLGVPSEILDDEGEYDEGDYDKGYKGRGYDLEGWEAELEDSKVTSSEESSSEEDSSEDTFSDESDVDSPIVYSGFSDETQARIQRYMEVNRWERLVLPLRHEILAIH